MATLNCDVPFLGRVGGGTPPLRADAFRGITDGGGESLRPDKNTAHERGGADVRLACERERGEKFPSASR